MTMPPPRAHRRRQEGPLFGPVLPFRERSLPPNCDVQGRICYVRLTSIVLKNPAIGHSSKNGFVEAFGLTGVERAFGEATKLARRQLLALAAAPSRNFLRRVSDLANCDRSENRGFSTQYVESGRSTREARLCAPTLDRRARIRAS